MRAALLAFQRELRRAHGAVLDGRDIGTVIFPDAPVKLFVTASLQERARRRWLELLAKGVRQRSWRQSARRCAHATRRTPRAWQRRYGRPTTPCVLDTTNLDAEAAFQAAMAAVHARLPAAVPAGVMPRASSAR